MSADRQARSMLPIPDRPPSGLTTYDAKDPDTAYPPVEPLLPPAGAPNVLVGDVGFGASSAFGGPCRTPTADRLAASGVLRLGLWPVGERAGWDVTRSAGAASRKVARSGWAL